MSEPDLATPAIAVALAGAMNAHDIDAFVSLHGRRGEHAVE